jgi:hypothetical protein
MHLLRDLRHIHISFWLTDNTHWGLKRLRARLAYFIAELNAHAADEAKKSLLNRFSMDVGTLEDRAKRHISNTGVLPRSRMSFKGPTAYLFGFEEFVALQGIKTVELTDVPSWYAECLALCMRGVGGELKETEWPTVKVKRKKRNCGVKKAVAVTTKEWWQPVYDWREFAIRNGVELPEDVDKYWEIKGEHNT